MATFLVLKGWKKDPKDKTTKCAHENDRWWNKYLEGVGDVRKKLSIATAELSRVKENRKLTRRGKKNCYLLQKRVEVFVSVIACKLHRKAEVIA